MIEHKSVFQHIIKEKLALYGDNVVNVTDEFEKHIKKDILNAPGYSDMLERGAKIIIE